MQRQNLAVTLLLDDISRVKMRTTVADLALSGVNIVSSLRDIKSYMLDKSKLVVILEGALEKDRMYSDLRLYKEVFGLEYVFIGRDESLLIGLQEIAQCYSMDPYVLDYDRLYGIVYDDTAVTSSYTTDFLLAESHNIAKELLASEGLGNRLKKLSESFLSVGGILSDRNEEINSLKKDIEDLSSEIQALTQNNNMLEQEYFRVLEDSLEMDRVLKQFEYILTQDVYDKVNLARYPKRPRIIYLKVYEELIYMNSFLDTLYRTLTYQRYNRVKVLNLYDSSSSKKLLVLPNWYVQIQQDFLKREVVANDFIYKVGPYKQLLDLLLINQSDLDILVIVDYKDHSDIVIQGSCLQLAICKSEARLERYGLDPKMSVVNFGMGDLSWDYYPEYANLLDSERLLFLTSRPVMSAILELEKMFNG